MSPTVGPTTRFRARSDSRRAPTDARGYLMWVDNVTVNALGNGSQAFALMQSVAAVGVPTIQSITVANGFATVTWNALSGSIYRLQFKDDLNAAEWTDVKGDVVS